jgi:hypothetical protein
MRKLGIILIAMLVTSFSHAAVDSEKIYFGGGLSLNSLSGLDLSDGTGFQFFGGYELPVYMGDGKLSAEVGYMDSGDMAVGPFFETDANGVWVNAVFTLPLQNKMNLIGRAGLDLGDDDGLMLGGGVGFQLDSKMQLRTEYVIRDNVDSLQFNLVFKM